MAKCIHINSPYNDEKVLSNRDFLCEFKVKIDIKNQKLIKLMTEDTQHRENFIKISRNLLRNNRYTDILPCNYFFNC